MKSEIEVKAKVRDVNNLVLKLKDIGCFLNEPVAQEDSIYNKKGIDLSSHSHGTSVLLIREQKERITFTLKKNRSNDLDCIEKEIEVTDKNTLEEMIELLDYEKTVEVHKKRQRGKYGDYEICLDEVEGLGFFIEVEKMSDEDGEKVQNELFDFLKKLGIEDEDRVLIGYDSLVWLKNNER
jgi:adenylate cyclase class 2